MLKSLNYIKRNCCIVWSVEKKSKSPRVVKKISILLKCTLSDSKKPMFSKEQKASGLLNNLGLKNPLI